MKVLVCFVGLTGESRNVRLVLQNLCVQLAETYSHHTELSEVATSDIYLSSYSNQCHSHIEEYECCLDRIDKKVKGYFTPQNHILSFYTTKVMSLDQKIGTNMKTH